MSNPLSTDMCVPREVVIAGKGPSFSRAPWDELPPTRVGLNHAALVMPGCTHAMAKDREGAALFAALPDHVIKCLRSPKMVGQFFSYPNICWWSHMVQCPTPLVGTAATCIELFAYYGARKFHLVGFDSMVDGGIEFAKEFDGVCEQDPRVSYKTYTASIVKALHITGSVGMLYL